MCHPRSLTFFTDHIKPEQVRGKRVLEVGAYNVNGTMRTAVQPMGPAEYIGVDLRPGPEVDIVGDFCKWTDADPSTFGAFDLVLCIASMEHYPDWRRMFRGLVRCLKPGGIMHFSVPTPGFSYHEELDCWRWTPDQVRYMFSDFRVIVEEVTTSPYLIQVIAQKPIPPDLDSIQPMEMVKP